MLYGPKGSEKDSQLQCSVCGRDTELTELPGRSELYCWECSADMATSILLVGEIDAATMAGREVRETKQPDAEEVAICRGLELKHLLESAGSWRVRSERPVESDQLQAVDLEGQFFVGG